VHKLLFVVVLTAILVAPAARATADDSPQPLVVVVATSSKLTGLSRADLKRCFAGEAVTAGGTRLIPFNLGPAAAERIRFDRVILGMSPSAIGRYWIDRRIRGGGGAPRALPSNAYVVKVVGKFPGAIGYLPADQVTSAVKVIAIDGLLPTNAGYPLAGR
jgi:hypothetical protein